MSKEVEPTEGQKTSEWGAMQWIKWSAGLASLIAGSLVVALPASGAVDASSLVVVVLGILSGVLAIVAGKAQADYTKSRTAVKVAKVTPPSVDLDELKRLLGKTD